MEFSGGVTHTSTEYTDAVRKAIFPGGDADTLACITVGIAQAYYKEIPKHIAGRVMLLLDPHIRGVVKRFGEKYGCGGV
ncbi:MAG: ADP-ribosylglycohydrolase family protein [Bacteroidota bacterium]